MGIMGCTMMQLLLSIILASFGSNVLGRRNCLGLWGRRKGLIRSIFAIPPGGDIDNAKSASMQSASEKVCRSQFLVVARVLCEAKNRCSGLDRSKN
jgi:hypothetical protein